MFPVPKSPITGYAGKNTEEAFCEAVGRLVAYGPLVIPETVRGWLRAVLPGIRIAGLATRTPPRVPHVREGSL